MISCTARVAKTLVFTGFIAGSALVSQAFAAEPFTLRSDTFKDGTLMPKRVANNTATNPNCVGENVSPHLAWSGVPEGTKSLIPKGAAAPGFIIGSPMAFPPMSRPSLKARPARKRPSSWAARALRASRSMQAPAHPRDRPITTHS